MQLETKDEYYSYIRDLEKMGVAQPQNCHNELMKRFPNLNDNLAEKLVNMYIREELENKQKLLLG